MIKIIVDAKTLHNRNNLKNGKEGIEMISIKEALEHITSLHLEKDDIEINEIRVASEDLNADQIFELCDFGFHTDNNDNRTVIRLKYEDHIRGCHIVIRYVEYLEGNNLGKHYSIMIFRSTIEEIRMSKILKDDWIINEDSNV